MTPSSPPTRNSLLAATAALALALAGAACSGDGGVDDTAADAPGARTTARTEEAAAAPARLATAEFEVEGMTCGGCALATEMAVKKLEGVASADASYDEATGEGRCTVEYDPSAVDTDRIAAAIEGAGFIPTLESTDESGG